MRIDSILKQVTVPRLLLFLFLYSGLVAYLIKGEVGNDGTTYLGYLEGWKLGRYTYWYDIPDYLPDTFRNPGFPALIALLGLISTSFAFLQGFHFVVYCTTVWLVLRILQRLIPGKRPVLLFAGLVLMNPVIPFHIVLITPEVVSGFLLVLMLHIRLFWADTWKRYIVLGLLFSFLFQVRPVVLFLPFLLFALDWWLQRARFAWFKQLSVLLIYVVSMLPYGYWNYSTHGIFSVTSIEGGGGVMHLGYWCPKMPGYYETRYWYNGAPVALINFAKPEDVPANIRAFEREWDMIDSLCAPYLTDRDRRNLPYMRAHPERFVTYNGRYTYEREKLLKKLAVQHYLEDWRYTLKIKGFTAFRLWVSGITEHMVHHPELRMRISAWVGPVTTGITFLLALVFVPLAFIRGKLSATNWLPVLLTVVYWGGIHLPFAIQARYTIPVRLLLLALTAASIHGVLFRKENQGKA